MKLSTVTNMFILREDKSVIPTEEGMRRCRDIGFLAMDVSVSNSKENPDHPLNGDNWERWVDGIGELAAELDVTLDSAHMPFFSCPDPMFEDPDKRAFVERAKYRSIAACGKWGVKWIVEHPYQARGDAAYAPETKRKNIEYYAPFIEAAAKANVGIAFENMIPAGKNVVRYPVTAWELVDFVDTINAPNVGVCWDFGHANFLYTDQCPALRRLGNRLKATHVQDNFGTADVHIVPFVGTVKWEPIMRTLKEIGYEGNFTYELGNYNRGKPEVIQTMHASHAYDVGKYLMSIYDGN